MDEAFTFIGVIGGSEVPSACSWLGSRASPFCSARRASSSRPRASRSTAWAKVSWTSWTAKERLAGALQAGMPVVGLGTWRVNLDDTDADPIYRAVTPQEAVAKAFSLIAGGTA